MSRARVVHEDAPHNASGYREEMRAVMPLNGLPVNQPDICLVDERRRLETVPDALSRHTASRDPVELLIDERNQPLEGVLVAVSPPEEQPGDLGVLVSNAAMLSQFSARSSFDRQFALLRQEE